MRRLCRWGADIAGTTWIAVSLSVMGWFALALMPFITKSGVAICRGAAFAANPPADDWSINIFIMWGCMILAMMGPTLSGPFYHIWHRSLARHRARNIALFLVSYVSIWCVVCSVLKYVLMFFSGADKLPPYGIMISVLAAAALWQFQWLKHYGLVRCHLRPPLAVFGAQSYLDPAFYGLRLAGWCILTCWALMALTISAPDNAVGVLAMISVTSFIFLERTSQSVQRRSQTIAQNLPTRSNGLELASLAFAKTKKRISV